MENVGPEEQVRVGEKDGKLIQLPGPKPSPSSWAETGRGKVETGTEIPPAILPVRGGQ